MTDFTPSIEVVKGKMVPGGWTDPRKAEEEVCILTKWMQNISESNTGGKYKEFNAVECRSQVVAGVKYLIKVQVGDNDYVHLMIFQSPLLGDTITTQFLRAKGGYKRDDHLVPF